MQGDGRRHYCSHSNRKELRRGSMADHVLVFPFPLQGHVNSMLKLAELLSLAGLHVTFLNTDHNLRLLARHSVAYARLDRSPRFRFRSIPDGFEDERRRSASRLLDLLESLQTRSVGPYKDLLLDLQHRDEDGYRGWPALTCVIADGIMTFAADVAREVGVPAMFFRTVSACSIWSYLCIPELLRTGELPFPDDADLDEPIRNVPGMEGFLRRRDLSIFCRNAKDSSDPRLRLVRTATADSVRARALILNTFESLEPCALEHIRSRCPVTYCIGPLHALLRTYYRLTSGSDHEEVRSTASASLWQEDRSCMSWLDAQPGRSVVYVSFGSLTVMSPEDFTEYWLGLVNSGQRFLWVVRRDLVDGKELGEGAAAAGATAAQLEKATRERGCLVEWVPQEEVLGHPAVGCFLTHSGWNSTLESLVAGVPMLCWPFFADQQTNSRFVGEVWRVGLDMKDMHGRDIVEKMVREMMEGNKAEELRTSAAKMAERARDSVSSTGGSSFMEFDKLIQDIRSLRP
ncbi:7-deoxyloganetic acid glucosyltransferase-like [Musa acuminata AAA Group]